MSLRRFLRLAPKLLLGLFLIAGTGVAILLGPYAWRVQHVEADAGKGFRSDYYLYVPTALRRDAGGHASLLVQPNNSGSTSDDISVHRRDAWMTGFERKRIADELGTPLGSTVGYTVRFTDQASDSTLIKLMTDGILLAEIQRDRRLLRYDTLILDEAHERSLNIDFLLGYLRELLPRRPDLKVIVTSALKSPPCSTSAKTTWTATAACRRITWPSTGFSVALAKWCSTVRTHSPVR